MTESWSLDKLRKDREKEMMIIKLKKKKLFLQFCSWILHSFWTLKSLLARALSTCIGAQTATVAEICILFCSWWDCHILKVSIHLLLFVFSQPGSHGFQRFPVNTTLLEVIFMRICSVYISHWHVCSSKDNSQKSNNFAFYLDKFIHMPLKNHLYE